MINTTTPIAEDLKSNEIALEKGLSWIKSQLKANGIDLPSRAELRDLIIKSSKIQQVEEDLMRRVTECAITHTITLK